MAVSDYINRLFTIAELQTTICNIVEAILVVTEPNGRSWEVGLALGAVYTIGRAKENEIVLNDRRVSRKHAYIESAGQDFRVVDGSIENGQIVRSVNHVYVNGQPSFEKLLENGDIVVIGESSLEFKSLAKVKAPSPAGPENAAVSFSIASAGAQTDLTPLGVNFDDTPLGHTMVQMSANEIIGAQSHASMESAVASPDEIKSLRRKARMLELLYEMSKTLGTVFDLKEIFEKATELIFRGTPADRVIALLADETADGKIVDYSMFQIGAKTRDENADRMSDKLTVSRTITHKVMREKVALLSQDARMDVQFAHAESIVSQGVRSTICAPLITESNVHGVLYADRLDPFAAFSADDLALVSAVAAQTAVTVETVKAHKRLAREEVARANYSRFMPEYVVRQLLENPDSFRLGGVNQTITVLFADIRGFTTVSEHENPEKVVGLLNKYFTAMTEIIFAHGGTLDKYIGDGLMALFGAPTATPNDAANALQAAVAMQKRLVVLNDSFRAEGYPAIGVGIGLHTGEATVGYVGSEKRSEYTAIGDTVNVASRLEGIAKSREVLLSEETAAAAGNIFPLTPKEPIVVKNRRQPVRLFELNWT